MLGIMLVNRSRAKEDPATRFWANVDIRTPNECWPWKLGCFARGYGQCNFFKLDMDSSPCLRQLVYTHRIAWVLTFGEIPTTVKVLHKCDNPPCCNPGHLFTGSQKDNVDDMMEKGRHGHGTTGPPPKFSPDLIEAAIAEYTLTKRPLDHVARDCGISETHLRRLVKARGIECRRRVHKLQPEQAQEVRDLYKTGQYTYVDLASKFGVTFANIGYIVRGKTFAG